MPATPDAILSLSRAFMGSRVFLTAVELDVFTLLAGEPLTAQEIAARLNATPDGMATLLNALVALEMLVKESGKYYCPAETAAILSPLGAYTSKFLSGDILLWMFTGFLLFAGSMMLFYKAKQKEIDSNSGRLIGYGMGVGSFAGYLGGLLGGGGGNFIVPVLVWLGFDPKKASATTAFIVIFSSLAGFFGHASLGHMNIHLLWITAMGSIAGAVLGAWLMGEKMKSRQVKMVIGVILYLIAAKMIWNLLT